MRSAVSLPSELQMRSVLSLHHAPPRESPNAIDSIRAESARMSVFFLRSRLSVLLQSIKSTWEPRRRGKGKEGEETNLGETNVCGLFTETLTTDVEAVFADQTGLVGAHAAVRGLNVSFCFLFLLLVLLLSVNIDQLCISIGVLGLVYRPLREAYNV